VTATSAVVLGSSSSSSSGSSSCGVQFGMVALQHNLYLPGGLSEDQIQHMGSMQRSMRPSQLYCLPQP
jgi:hypothetical protein